VPAVIAYTSHDAQGWTEVDHALLPVSVMGTRPEDCHFLNYALKTPSGRIYCGNGDAQFNTVAEWEHALRQALRAQAAQ